MAPWPAIPLAGALIGALMGFFGVGGSSVATPVLSLLGVGGLAAVASPLPATIPSAVLAAVPYVRGGEARPKAAAWTLLGAVPATIVGALLSRWIGGGALVLAVREDLQHWVNDALMVVFFFLIGLEIKRELVVGELRDPKAASLAALAALGGMVVPAVLFLALAGGGEAGRGWAIPMATDIAFVVGILALLGSRVPARLKVFLLTLAIVDDIGAIVVIAAFYSSGLSGMWLAGAVAALAAVVVVRRLGLVHPIAFVPIGVIAWYCTYRAGIHPTIAGAPRRWSRSAGAPRAPTSPLEQLSRGADLRPGQRRSSARVGCASYGGRQQF